MYNNRFSREISIFHGILAPETGILAGYGAIIEAFDLPVPVPELLTLISYKHRQYSVERWQVLTPRHAPADTLYKQLAFALRYEGVNLLVLKKLFERLEQEEIIKLVRTAQAGQYSRKIWFLYEWLTGFQLDISDQDRGNYWPVIRDDLQFGTEGVRSPRHRIINNLPGTPAFCPLIRRTQILESFIKEDLASVSRTQLNSVHKDILQRTSAFLLVKDSQASFAIEGESPKSKRMARWAMTLGQAGTIPLSREELLRLQQIVIESDRFIKMGFRTEGGFVGEHDRTTFEPIPDHISARWQDVDNLLDGLIDTSKMLQTDSMDPVLVATVISFGFVFIHPFIDGNGRIHRYLIHHILAMKKYSPQGIIFPVSASILDKVVEYRNILEAYSRPLLDLIDWRTTEDRNIEVLNDTADYYRYFDATRQAEFLYACVKDTISHIIPEEIQYLERFDEFKRFAEEMYNMPDRTISLLINFLQQNNGNLSNRARTKEFIALRDDEVEKIQAKYREIFTS